MNTIAIIQTRMFCERMPGKALAELASQPLLAHLVERLQRCRSLRRVVIATTVESDDDPIEQLCTERAWNIFRGSTDDLLDRLYQAAAFHEADTVVRVFGNCPLIDPELVDDVAQRVAESAGWIDYASNFFPKRTYPHGLEVEAVRMPVLRKLWQTRAEHAPDLTAAIAYDADAYRTQCAESPDHLDIWQWSVDTFDDYQFMRSVFRHFGHNRMSWRAVAKACQNPARTQLRMPLHTQRVA